MPLIVVYGMPSNVSQERLEKTVEDLRASLEEDPKRYLINPGTVSVFFPSDRLEAGLGEELVAVVTTREKPLRTDKMLESLAHTVVGAINRHVFSPHVECFIRVVKRNHFHSLENKR